MKHGKKPQVNQLSVAFLVPEGTLKYFSNMIFLIYFKC